MLKQEQRKQGVFVKSEEQLRDEKLKPAVLKAIQRLKTSKILDSIPPEAFLIDPFLGSKSFLRQSIACFMVSLDKHQRESNKIAVLLRRYRDRQESRLSKLDKASCDSLDSEREGVRTGLLVSKEILRYSCYEHENYWKDWAYWELFKRLRFLHNVKYEDVLGIISKIVVLFSQSAAACQETETGTKRFIYRISPKYSKDGRCRLVKEKVRLPGDQRICRRCRDLLDSNEELQCGVEICDRERSNIAKRIYRLKAKKKELLVYDERKHGELSWEQLLQGKQAFLILEEKGLINRKPAHDVTDYLKEKIKQRYLKHCVDPGILRKILRHLQINENKGLLYLFSDDAFLEAISIQE